jgi:GAF domain-containing protein
MRTALLRLAGALFAAVLAAACSTPLRSPATSVPPAPPPAMTLDEIGQQYLRLVLALGVHDPDYVDAYYGPAALRDEVTREAATLAHIARHGQALLEAVDGADVKPGAAPPERVRLRRAYLVKQLAALVARASMLTGTRYTFDEEARALYDTAAPHYSDADFAPVLAAIAKRLPRERGDDRRTLAERYNRYLDRLAVPAARLDKVMRLAIDESRTRTAKQLALPAGETFELAFVRGQPWSAYNWYQGARHSRIEINTDLPIGVSRVIELASHEGYPGHHVYNALLEQTLVDGQGWPEYQVYALFSPQSLIAEGSADFGIGLAFPGPERLAFTKRLFKAAGLPVQEAARYHEIVGLAKRLTPAGIEAARRYLDGEWTAEATTAHLQRTLLYSPERAAQRLKFIEKYRAYLINYSWGEERVRADIERHGDAVPGSTAQWWRFHALLSEPRTPAMLAAPDSHR